MENRPNLSKTVMLPIDHRQLPDNLMAHLDAYGISFEELVNLTYDSYSYWDDPNPEVRCSRIEWFLNQMGFTDGTDGNGHDVVGPGTEWLVWEDTVSILERAVSIVKSQTDYFLQYMGFLPPRWPNLFLLRMVGDDLLVSIVAHRIGA